MKISLNDKVVRTVVQEYVNAIVNYQSERELDFDVHKLIHTFQVVAVARELVKLTKQSLSKTVKKQILNAAALHDIGRCHEFKNGSIRAGYDHGAAGAALIKKYCPNLIVEQACTRWHNKRPSNKDPKAAQPILDYTRDADILGNIQYNTENMAVFIKHILEIWELSDNPLTLNDEIRKAAIEKRSCVYANMKKFDFGDMLVAQLLWIYNLRTEAAFRFVKKHRVFSKYRAAIITQALPYIKGSAVLRKKMAEDIRTLFPDSLFEEVLKRHGL